MVLERIDVMHRCIRETAHHSCHTLPKNSAVAASRLSSVYTLRFVVVAIVRCTWLPTVGGRAFPVAVAHCSSLQQFAAASYAVITIAIRLRYDYDPTTTYRARLLPIRRRQKMNISIFRRSRIVVVS